MLEAARALGAFLAGLGVSPGELLSVGSVWAAVAVLRRRLTHLEKVHATCPHAGAFALVLNNPQP